MIKTALNSRLAAALLKRAYGTLRRTFTPAQIAMMAVLCVILGMLLYAAIQLIVPYRPFIIYGYDHMPERACPNENIELWVDSELKDHLRVLDIKYFWSPEELAGGEKFGGELRLSDVEPYDRRIQPSILGRQLPERPGNVQLVTEYEGYGERWGSPVRQDLTFVSEDVVTVLPKTDERCR